MNKQKTITLKLTADEVELLVSALYSEQRRLEEMIENGTQFPDSRLLTRCKAAAEAQMPTLNSLAQRIFDVRFGMQMEQLRAALEQAQKNPPADATNIRQGQASHGDLP